MRQDGTMLDYDPNNPHQSVLGSDRNPADLNATQNPINNAESIEPNGSDPGKLSVAHDNLSNRSA